MSNISSRTQKLLCARLGQLAIEVELATTKLSLEITQEPSEKVSRSIRPTYEIFADSRPLL